MEQSAAEAVAAITRGDSTTPRSPRDGRFLLPQRRRASPAAQMLVTAQAQRLPTDEVPPSVAGDSPVDLPFEYVQHAERLRVRAAMAEEHGRRRRAAD